MQVRKTRTNQERSEATRKALLAAARPLFVSKGYASTGTPEIVAAAGLTRGALYHQFEDKRALFEAVLEQEARAVAEAIEAATPQNLSAMEALLAGAEAYLQAMRAEGRTRLLLIDGPAVLGREAMNAMERKHGDRTLAEGLQVAIESGAVVALPLTPLADLLAAMFERAALLAEQHPPAKSLAVMKAVLEGLAPRT